MESFLESSHLYLYFEILPSSNFCILSLIIIHFELTFVIKNMDLILFWYLVFIPSSFGKPVFPFPRICFKHACHELGSMQWVAGFISGSSHVFHVFLASLPLPETCCFCYCVRHWHISMVAFFAIGCFQYLCFMFSYVF